MTNDNVYTAPSGARACRTCVRDRNRAHVAKQPGYVPGRPVGRPRATHCKHGHELAREGVYTAPNGDRSCRTCRKAASERHELRHMRAVSARLIASLNLGEPTAEELEGDARQRATEERWITEGRFDDVD